ncbi:MAG: hypothetical protein HRU46_07780, partial [Verrucomicrobiales bacterium]|nr:hypothetical protein [Verrucomicrobiales bacterium]
MGDMIISERMLSDLKSEGVSGFRAHPIRLFATPGPGKQTEVSYLSVFLLEILGRVELDIPKFNGGEDSLCRVCGAWRPDSRKHVFGHGKVVVLPFIETWDGSDFCKFSNFSFGETLCSPRMVGLQAKYSWRGMCFKGLSPKLGMIIEPEEEPDWKDRFEELVRKRYPDR